MKKCPHADISIKPTKEHIMLDFDRFNVLTFDCYGTLIDWEKGIVAALKKVFAEVGKKPGDDEMLTVYADIESELEAGGYRTYKETLRVAMDRFGKRFGFDPNPVQRNSLVTSLPDWPPFDDTVASLRALRRKYKLAVISNIDDDLFAETAKRLEVSFDWVITAEQVGGYKPSLKNFEYAFRKIGVPKERILHIAQSIYHDIVPANQLGLAAVWVNRRRGRPGFGATKPASGEPDLEVPDLASLVGIMGL